MGILKLVSLKPTNFDHVGKRTKIIALDSTVVFSLALPNVVWRCTFLYAPLFLKMWKLWKESRESFKC